MNYDKNIIKDKLDIDDVFQLLEELGAEPVMRGDNITCRTICHNGDSKDKLIFYSSTNLFHCYTSTCGTFDIFELVSRVRDIDLPHAIEYVADFFHLYAFAQQDEMSLEDWKVLERYEKRAGIKSNKDRIILPEYDNVIKYYPHPHIPSWEEQGIAKDICDFAGIAYNPEDGSILIPHYDADNRLIGIRRRTMVEDIAEQLGKYTPARINNVTYAHPLAFNLYGLNWVKDNIKNTGVAICVEGEKSVLQSLSYLGISNSLTVAVCGQSISKYQFQLLLDLGIKELVVGFDADFHEIGDNDFSEVVRRLEKIYNKFSSYVNVSFLFDKTGLLGYKDSPFDKGKEVFEYLWRNRVTL